MVFYLKNVHFPACVALEKKSKSVIFYKMFNLPRKYRKFGAIALIPLYVLTQVLTPDTAQAAVLSFAESSPEVSVFETWKPSARFGTVTEKVVPKNSHGTLVHIQDAHAVLDAQQNIQNMLSEMQSQGGIHEIYLEGGTGELDPDLHHFFPGGKKLTATERNAWMRDGDLTGAETFLMKSKNVKGYGIEDAAAYWDNVEQYRKVDSALTESRAFLRSFFSRWQDAAIHFLSPSLKKYLEAYARSRLDAVESAEWFNAIQQYADSVWKRDLADIHEQIEFPMLVRYYHLKNLARAADFSKIEKQKLDFLETLKSLDQRPETRDRRLEAQTPRGLPVASPEGAQRGASSLKAILIEIDNLIEKAKTRGIDPEAPADFSAAREVFERLAVYLPNNFSMDKWPELKAWIAQIILSGEMDAVELQKEAEKMHAQIVKEAASVIPAKAGIQKHLGLDSRPRGNDHLEIDKGIKLIKVLEKYILLHKLLHLELSRSEFKKIEKRLTTDDRRPTTENSFKPSEVVQQLEAVFQNTSGIEPQPITGSVRSGSFSDLEKTYDNAIQFYQGAIARERSFTKNLNNYFSESFATSHGPRQRRIEVIVTGGFHSDGMREFAQKNQYAYVEVMPRISKITEDDRAHYRRALLGEGSVPSLPAGRLDATRGEQSRTKQRGLTSMVSNDSHVTAALATSAGIFKGRSELRMRFNNAQLAPLNQVRSEMRDLKEAGQPQAPGFGASLIARMPRVELLNKKLASVSGFISAIFTWLVLTAAIIFYFPRQFWKAKRDGVWPYHSWNSYFRYLKARQAGSLEKTELNKMPALRFQVSDSVRAVRLRDIIAMALSRGVSLKDLKLLTENDPVRVVAGRKKKRSDLGSVRVSNGRFFEIGGTLDLDKFILAGDDVYVLLPSVGGTTFAVKAEFTSGEVYLPRTAIHYAEDLPSSARSETRGIAKNNVISREITLLQKAHFVLPRALHAKLRLELGARNETISSQTEVRLVSLDDPTKFFSINIDQKKNLFYFRYKPKDLPAIVSKMNIYNPDGKMKQNTPLYFQPAFRAFYDDLFGIPLAAGIGRHQKIKEHLDALSRVNRKLIRKISDSKRDGYVQFLGRLYLPGYYMKHPQDFEMIVDRATQPRWVMLRYKKNPELYFILEYFDTYLKTEKEGEKIRIKITDEAGKPLRKGYQLRLAEASGEFRAFDEQVDKKVTANYGEDETVEVNHDDAGFKFRSASPLKVEYYDGHRWSRSRQANARLKAIPTLIVDSSIQNGAAIAIQFDNPKKPKRITVQGITDQKGQPVWFNLKGYYNLSVVLRLAEEGLLPGLQISDALKQVVAAYEYRESKVQPKLRNYEFDVRSRRLIPKGFINPEEARSFRAEVRNEKAIPSRSENRITTVSTKNLNPGQELELLEDVKKRLENEHVTLTGAGDHFIIEATKRSELRVDDAIAEIQSWNREHGADSLKEDTTDPFQTRREIQARKIYHQYGLEQVSIEERAKYVRVVFQDIAGPVVQFIDGWIDALSPEERASHEPLSPAFFQKISSKMADLEHRYTILHNQFIRTAGDLIFDLDPTEKNILELRGLADEITKELDGLEKDGKPGRGNIPVVAAMQDLHGGTRRALALLAFVYGLPADSYARIHILNDLKEQLDEKGLSLEKFLGRIIGFSDAPDRGPDPVGSIELIDEMVHTSIARFLLGNHDEYRALSALGIHKLFPDIDLYSEEHTGHHVGFWLREAFHHADWGDVELDQLNQRRFNKIVKDINQRLRTFGAAESFEFIDLAKVRQDLKPELKRIKAHNSKLRQKWQGAMAAEKEAALLAKRAPNPIPKPAYLPNINIFEETSKMIRGKMDAYQRQIVTLRETYADLPGFENFTPLTLGNYDTDREIVYSAINQLRNFRLFYLDIYNNLHLHNMIPIDEQGQFNVKYRGQTGLAALELMTRDIRTYFEGLSDADIEKYITGSKSERMAFRRALWNVLGPAFEEITSWYSDKLLHAKVDMVKKFADHGQIGWLMGHTAGSFVDRSPNGFIIMGHNEQSKFPNKQMSPFVLFPSFGSGILNIDGEMSPGYEDLGIILTYNLRDEKGYVTGLKLWGFPDKKDPHPDVIQDLTLVGLEKLRQKAIAQIAALGGELSSGTVPTEAIEEKQKQKIAWEKLEASLREQIPLFEKLTDGKTFLRWTLFKTTKELERQLTARLAKDVSSDVKRQHFEQMLRNTTVEMSKLSNPLFETTAPTPRSEARSAPQNPKASMRSESRDFPKVLANFSADISLVIHSAASEKLRLVLGSEHVHEDNEIEVKDILPANYPIQFKGEFQKLTHNADRLDQFRKYHNEVLIKLASVSRWKQAEADEFMRNFDMLVKIFLSFEGMTSADLVGVRERWTDLEAQYQLVRSGRGGSITVFFDRMRGIWTAAESEKGLSKVDTLNKFINWMHSYVEHSVLKINHDGKWSFLDLDHVATGEPSLATKILPEAILKNLKSPGVTQSNDLSILLKGTNFWMRKTLGVHRMQAYANLVPLEMGGNSEFVYFEGGAKVGNHLRMKLIARVFKKLGFRVVAPAEDEWSFEKMVLRASLDHKQNVSDLSVLMRNTKIAMDMLLRIVNTDQALRDLAESYSKDELDQIIEAWSQKIILTAGKVTPIDIPMNYTKSSAGEDDTAAVPQKIVVSKGKFWESPEPYDDAQNVEFRENGKKIHSALQSTLAALGLEAMPEYDSAVFGQIFIETFFNSVVSRTVNAGRIIQGAHGYEINPHYIASSPIRNFVETWQDLSKRENLIQMGQMVSNTTFRLKHIGLIGQAMVYSAEVSLITGTIEVVLVRSADKKSLLAGGIWSQGQLLTPDAASILLSRSNIEIHVSKSQPGDYARLADNLEMEFRTPAEGSIYTGEAIQGFGFLPGTATGPIRFSEGAQEGDILYVSTLNEGNINLLRMANGVISEVGNKLDHFNTRAKHFGKPRVQVSHAVLKPSSGGGAALEISGKIVDRAENFQGYPLIQAVTDGENIRIEEGDLVTINGTTGMIHWLGKDPVVLEAYHTISSIEKAATASELEKQIQKLIEIISRAVQAKNILLVKFILRQIIFDGTLLSPAHKRGSLAQLFQSGEGKYFEQLKNLLSPADDELREGIKAYLKTLYRHAKGQILRDFSRAREAVGVVARLDQIYYEIRRLRTEVAAFQAVQSFLGEIVLGEPGIDLNSKQESVFGEIQKTIRHLKAQLEERVSEIIEQNKKHPFNQETYFLLARILERVAAFEKLGIRLEKINQKQVAKLKKDAVQIQKQRRARRDALRKKRLIALSDTGIDYYEITGNKGANLGWLNHFVDWYNGQKKNKSMRLSVALGYAVTAHAFNEFLDQTVMGQGPKAQTLRAYVKSVLADRLLSIKEKSQKIEEAFLAQELPQEMSEEISRVVSGGLWAVRSSTKLEDTPRSSAAGLFATNLGATTPALVEKYLRQTWASLYGEPSLSYLWDADPADFFDLLKDEGAVIQQLISADTSGVISSVEISSDDRGFMVINAGYGLGQAIVDADQDADAIVVDKVTKIPQIFPGEKRKKTIVDGKGATMNVETTPEERNTVSLSRAQIAELTDITLALEEWFGYVVQVEFAIKDSVIYLLQIRPIPGFKVPKKERPALAKWAGMIASQEPFKKQRSEARSNQKLEVAESHVGRMSRENFNGESFSHENFNWKSVLGLAAAGLTGLGLALSGAWIPALFISAAAVYFGASFIPPSQGSLTRSGYPVFDSIRGAIDHLKIGFRAASNSPSRSEIRTPAESVKYLYGQWEDLERQNVIIQAKVAYPGVLTNEEGFNQIWKRTSGYGKGVEFSLEHSATDLRQEFQRLSQKGDITPDDLGGLLGKVESHKRRLDVLSAHLMVTDVMTAERRNQSYVIFEAAQAYTNFWKKVITELQQHLKMPADKLYARQGIQAAGFVFELMLGGRMDLAGENERLIEELEAELERVTNDNLPKNTLKILQDLINRRWEFTAFAENPEEMRARHAYLDELKTFAAQTYIMVLSSEQKLSTAQASLAPLLNIMIKIHDYAFAASNDWPTDWNHDRQGLKESLGYVLEQMQKKYRSESRDDTGSLSQRAEIRVQTMLEGSKRIFDESDHWIKTEDLNGNLVDDLIWEAGKIVRVRTRMADGSFIVLDSNGDGVVHSAEIEEGPVFIDWQPGINLNDIQHIPFAEITNEPSPKGSAPSVFRIMALLLMDQKKTSVAYWGNEGAVQAPTDRLFNSLAETMLPQAEVSIDDLSHFVNMQRRGFAQTSGLADYMADELGVLRMKFQIYPRDVKWVPHPFERIFFQTQKGLASIDVRGGKAQRLYYDDEVYLAPQFLFGTLDFHAQRHTIREEDGVFKAYVEDEHVLTVDKTGKVLFERSEMRLEKKVEVKATARSEHRAIEPVVVPKNKIIALKIMAARLFADGILSVKDAVYYLKHHEEFLAVLPLLVSTEQKKQNLAHLTGMLGVDIQVKDGIVLSPALVREGFLAAAKEVFEGVPFALIASGSEKIKAVQWIQTNKLTERIFVAENIREARVWLTRHGVTRIQGMALAGEEALPDFDELIRFTTGQLQKFYDRAGILGEVQHLARIFSVFASAA